MILNILYLFLFLYCNNCDNETNYKDFELSKLEVKEEKIFLILDTLIAADKKCKYFSDDLIYVINYNIISQDSSVLFYFGSATGLSIESIEGVSPKDTLRSNFKKVLGGFYYRDHYIEVSGRKMLDLLFDMTNDKIIVKRSRVEEATEEWHSYRRYLYKSNRFSLKESFECERLQHPNE